jgi:hypothetical protein
MRRVGERMVLAVLLLAVYGLVKLIGPRPDPAATASIAKADTTVAGVPASAEARRAGAGAVNDPIEGLPKLQRPSWIASQEFYIIPPIPTVAQPRPSAAQQAQGASQGAASQGAAAQASAPLPRTEVPLPVPRPDL